MFRRILGKSSDEGQRSPNTKLALKYLVKGDEFIQRQQYDLAIKAFTEAILLDRDCADAYVQRAVALQNKGKIRHALIDVQKAIDLNSKETSYYGMRAWLRLYSSDNWAGVIDDCGIALESKGVPLEFRCMVLGFRIWAKQLLGDNSWTNDLVPYAQLMEKRATNDPSILQKSPFALMAQEIGMEGVSMSFAYGAMHQKKYSEAVKNFTYALDINQFNSFAFLNRGIAYLFQHNVPIGLQDFNSAINVDTDFAYPYYFRGISYILMGDRVSAKTNFARHVELGGDRSLVSGERIRNMVNTFKD